MPNHDDTATSWRDLADQLTDRQRATLERFEADESMPADTLLDFARDHIEARLTDIAYADVPIPPGAKVGQWEQNPAGGWSRSLLWVEYGEPEISIDIDGRQEHSHLHRVGPDDLAVGPSYGIPTCDQRITGSADAAPNTR